MNHWGRILERFIVNIPYRRLVGRVFFLSLLAVQLFGCAASRKPLTGLVPGRNVETLQSSVSISASAAGRSSAGRGYLIYQAPDLYHLAILSPFGQTILEAFGGNDRFTCVVPSQQLAYTGALSDLPEASALKSIQLLRWVMAPSPVPLPAPPRYTMTDAGTTFYFDQTGLLEKKVSASGNEVGYEGYQAVEGIAFPETITIRDVSGAEARIIFDEPQLNAPVEGGALHPDLTGMTVLPLADFRAM